MDKLLIEVIRQVYEYDNTYNIKFDSFETVDGNSLFTDAVFVLKSGTTVIVTAQIVEPI